MNSSRLWPHTEPRRAPATTHFTVQKEQLWKVGQNVMCWLKMCSCVTKLHYCAVFSGGGGRWDYYWDCICNQRLWFAVCSLLGMLQSNSSERQRQDVRPALSTPGHHTASLAHHKINWILLHCSSENSCALMMVWHREQLVYFLLVFCSSSQIVETTGLRKKKIFILYYSNIIFFTHKNKPKRQTRQES